MLCLLRRHHPPFRTVCTIQTVAPAVRTHICRYHGWHHSVFYTYSARNTLVARAKPHASVLSVKHSTITPTTLLFQDSCRLMPLRSLQTLRPRFAHSFEHQIKNAKARHGTCSLSFALKFGYISTHTLTYRFAHIQICSHTELLTYQAQETLLEYGTDVCLARWHSRKLNSISSRFWEEK